MRSVLGHHKEPPVAGKLGRTEQATDNPDVVFERACLVNKCARGAKPQHFGHGLFILLAQAHHKQCSKTVV